MHASSGAYISVVLILFVIFLLTVNGMTEMWLFGRFYSLKKSGGCGKDV